MTIRELIEIAKTITLDDALGGLSLFAMLFMGLFFVGVFQ